MSYHKDTISHQICERTHWIKPVNPSEKEKTDIG